MACKSALRLVERGAPPPDECPTCAAIVGLGSNLGPNEIIEADIPPARSDVIGAPLIRSKRAAAIQRFENHAFKRTNCDDERGLLTNLHDNNREGDVAAVLETPSTNETMRMMRDNIEQARQQGRDTIGANAMMHMGGGWGVPDGRALAAMGPSSLPGRPVVDLQTKKTA